MATGTSYNDREFLFRLQTLVIDGGTEVVRNIFDQKLQNQPLSVFLANERARVNNLRRQKIITQAQYDLLYPSSGPPPTSNDFDITLIVCLLRNLPSLGLNQNYTWNIPPQPSDTTVEADLIRLTKFRNSIAHISSTTGYQRPSFLAKYAEVEQVLLRLNSNSPTPLTNLKQTIDSYKNSPMDPATEKRINDEWDKMEKDLKTDMLHLRADITKTKDDITTVKKDLSDTKDVVTTVKKDLGDTKDDVTTVKKNLSDTKDDVTTVKKGLSDTKDDVTTFKKDLSDTKDDVTTVRKDLSYTKDDVTTVKNDLSDTKDVVTTVKKDLSDTKDAVTTVKKNLSDTNDAVTTVKKDLSDTNDDITTVRKDLSDTKDAVTTVKKDLSDTKDVVTTVKKDLSDTKDVVTTVKKDLSDTKDVVTTVKKDLSDTNDDVTTVKKGLSDTNDDVTTVKKDLSDTNDVVTTVKKDLSDTKDAVTTVKRDLSDTKDDVTSIKKDVSVLKEGMPSQEEIEKAAAKAHSKMKSNLRDDLISFYKDKHRSVPLCPLLDEAQPLLKFYVMPDIQSVKVTRSRDGDTQEKTPVKTLRDVFFKEQKLCSNIYLTADAGYGKTAFSKKLALAWCQAKQPDKNEERHFSKDEITAMGGFSYVFLVLLRDSSSECDIDMLILNQICPQLKTKHKFYEECLATILSEETCLVILDGLDEWTHPLNSCRQGESKIPHQRVRENVAVLTTTRPWKLSVIGLHSNQIDQKLELEGLSDDSAKKLKKSVISYLYEEENKLKIDKYENEFSMSVKESHKSDLTAIPLFLLYLIFLWYYKFKVGKSLADLYSSFIELLLSRTVIKEGITIPKTKTVQGNIPPCFNDKELCKQFYTLLTPLGKLAFHTLFSEQKENMLVFDGRLAEKYLRKDELTFCLETGIITQSKVLGDVSLQQKTKVSFAHKTMQEFLAALYIHSVTDQKSLQETVLSKCKCVKDILDMSKMLMFIVSISAKFSFSCELMKIINEDEITQEYRRSLQGLDMFSRHPLKDLQDMYISCCKEIPRENEVNLCLQDVFISGSCLQEEYGENLKRLTTRNKQNIRSVYIDMDYMENTPYNTGRELIDYFSLIHLENVEKIHYRGEYSDDVILPWLNSSVKSLYLSSGIFQRGSWSRSLCDKVTSLHKLEAIGIRGFNMGHSERRLLMDFISRRNCLREIELRSLSCTDHEWRSPCTGLDLTGLKSLRRLTLGGLELSSVIINMSSLEECVLQFLSNRDLELKFINSADNKLNTFTCEWLQSSAVGDEIVRTLRHSPHIRQIDLSWVTMEASVLGELVDSVLKLKQTVTVDIDHCTILPREEFETLKGKIKTSQRVRRLRDEEDILGNRFRCSVKNVRP